MTNNMNEAYAELDPKVAYARLILDSSGAYSIFRFKGCEQILIPKSGIIAVTQLMSQVASSFDSRPIATIGSLSHYDRGQSIAIVKFEHGQQQDNLTTLELLQNIIMTASCGRTVFQGQLIG